MIEDPPLLTIRREIPRAAPEVLERFRDVPTSWIVDALEGRGALDHTIRAMLQGPDIARHVVGSALPCLCSGNDNLALAAGLSLSAPGDMVMVANEGFRAACVGGDLLMGIARNRGVAGFVTDGLVRDVAALEQVGLPVFAAGVTPNSCARNGPGTVGLPVSVGGHPVASGDVVVADRDGVVVVPAARITEVLARLEHIRELEAALERQVTDGLDGLPAMAEMLASDRVRWV